MWALHIAAADAVTFLESLSRATPCSVVSTGCSAAATPVTASGANYLRRWYGVGSTRCPSICSNWMSPLLIAYVNLSLLFARRVRVCLCAYVSASRLIMMSMMWRRWWRYWSSLTAALAGFVPVSGAYSRRLRSFFTAISATVQMSVNWLRSGFTSTLHR